jgi:hypothetical protein
MLYRSIYFMFRDEKSVRAIISELESKLGLEDYQLHAVVAHGHGLVEMPGGTVHRKSPATARLERLLWYLSITIFVIALIALALSLLAASWILALFFGLLVVGAQLSGYLFVNRIPNAQLDRFRTGLEQGDIVLQVDVPRKDVELVRNFVYNRYPDSRTNISNWHIGAFGM